jgi:hypothetical protein
MRWPATGKSAGVGIIRMIMSAAVAATRPQFDANQPFSFGVAGAAADRTDG